MSAKNTIAEIKKLLGFGEDKPEEKKPEEKKFEGVEYKLADGTEVYIDKLEVGGSVMVDELPAPDGEHTLADGTVLVTAAGLITEVRKPAPVEAPVEAKSEMTALAAEIFASIQKLEKRMDEEKQLREQAAKSHQQAFAKVVELLEQVADEPVEKTIEEEKDWEKMTPLQKFRAQKKIFSN